MVWRIEFDSDVEKDLLRIDHSTQKRIMNYLRHRVAVCENPKTFGKPLQGSFGGFWRYRVGDYRIICKIETTSITILIVRIGHRKNIYF